MRMMLAEYLEELTTEKTKIGPKRLLKTIKQTMRIETMTSSEKFAAVRDICSSQSFLTDGDSMDRLSRIIGEIGKTVERMNRIQTQDNFILTPDGLKVLLRSIVDVIKGTVKNEEEIKEIREKMLELSVRTKGNFGNINDDVQDADYRKVNG